MSAAPPFHRPLSAEPLSLDLINTEWGLDEQHRDLLTTVEGVQAWLQEIGQDVPAELLPDIRTALLDMRTVIRRVLENPHDENARMALNARLAHGRLLRLLGPAGPQEQLEVPENERVAWLAADNLLTLLRAQAGQIRRCGNPRCTLYFLDSSKNHSRTWCSMKTCGNRAKFRRHAHRRRERITPPEA